MRKVEIDNAEAMVERDIKNGRIIGLTAWEGRKAIVIVERD